MCCRRWGRPRPRTSRRLRRPARTGSSSTSGGIATRAWRSSSARGPQVSAPSCSRSTRRSPERRLRDARNGFSIPPALTAKTLFDIALHPGWWFDILTTEPLKFASLDAWHGPVADLIDQLFDPALNLKDVAWLREVWPAPLIIKGIQTVDDARMVADAGADAIVISNHGGRQLDRAPVPLEQLPDIVKAVGDRVEVYLDGGIMNGGDVVAAVGMGARAALVGRAYLYGLMAGGEAGVQRAGDLLTKDITRTMRLLGANDLSELTTDRVRLRAS